MQTNLNDAGMVGDFSAGSSLTAANLSLGGSYVFNVNHAQGGIAGYYYNANISLFNLSVNASY